MQNVVSFVSSPVHQCWLHTCFPVFSLFKTRHLWFVCRILFCYARDRAVPLSWLWVKVDARTKTPLCAIWGVVLATFCLGLPMLGSLTAFSAILSLSTIALIIVYVAPTTLRITAGRKKFTPGPFYLGAWAFPVGIVSTLWCGFATVVFCLPTEYPVTTETVNYAAMALLGTIFLSLLWFYLPFVGAYKTFKGPARTVADEEDGYSAAHAAALPAAKLVY